MTKLDAPYGFLNLPCHVSRLRQALQWWYQLHHSGSDGHRDGNPDKLSKNWANISLKRQQAGFFFKYHVSQRIPRVVFCFFSLLLHCQIQTEIGLRNPVLRNSGGLSVRQLDVLESLFEVRHEILVFINPKNMQKKGRFAMNCRISSLVTVSVSVFINIYHRKRYFCRMLYYHFSALSWGLLSVKNERPHYAWWNDEWSMWVEVGRGHLLFARKLNGFALCKWVTWFRPEQGKDQNISKW